MPECSIVMFSASPKCQRSQSKNLLDPSLKNLLQFKPGRVDSKFFRIIGLVLQHSVPEQFASVIVLSSPGLVGAEETYTDEEALLPASTRQQEKKLYYSCFFTGSAVFWAKITFFSREERPLVQNFWVEKVILQFLFRQAEL